MTAAREAIYLPALLLTVTLLAGLRPGSAVVAVPPSLFSLVLAVLLIAVLVQSGAFAPLRVMNPSRAALANLNGGVLVVTLMVAAAQTFSLLTPEAGLPRVLFSVYFLVLMINTMAASPDRVRVLRSLAVTFGAAFVLKFIVLDALSDPAGSRLARVLQVLFEGATLGTVTQDAQHPAAGYVAFAAIVMFLAALALLPSAAAELSTSRTIVSRDADRRPLPARTPASPGGAGSDDQSELPETENESTRDGRR